jgi:hypothetical protein
MNAIVEIRPEAELIDEIEELMFTRPPNEALDITRGCNGVKYMNYMEQGRVRTLVSRKKVPGEPEPLGEPLDNFAVQQIADENSMALERIYAKHMRLGAESFVESFIIAKVTANALDTIRCVYADIDGEVPVLIASNHMQDFTELDVGNVVKLHKPAGRTTVNAEVSREINGENISSLCMEFLDAVNNQKLELQAYLAAAKKVNLQAYMTSDTSVERVESATIGIFAFKKNKATYGDIVIDLRNKPLRNEMINELLDHGYANNFESAFRYMVKNSGEKGIIVNGTPIRYEHKVKTNVNGISSDLFYINGKKIPRNDVNAVIDAVTCFPNAPEEYMSYLSTITKMSLRFHTMVKEGMTLRVDANDFLEGGSHNLPTYMKASTWGSDAVLNIQVKKKPLEPMEIFWMGKWRKVDGKKVDKLVKVLAHNDYKYRPGVGAYQVENNSSSNIFCSEVLRKKNLWHSQLPQKIKDKTDKTNASLKVLNHVDECLVTKDQVLYRKKTAIKPRYAQPQHKKWLWKIAKEFCEMTNEIMQERIEIVEKSRELLENVIEQEGIEEVTFNEKKAYVVTGQSGAKYRVLHENASVYDHATGKHICVVNGGADQIGYNYLVGVLAALAADTYTARNIHTIKGKVEA